VAQSFGGSCNHRFAAEVFDLVIPCRSTGPRFEDIQLVSFSRHVVAFHFHVKQLYIKSRRSGPEHIFDHFLHSSIIRSTRLLMTNYQLPFDLSALNIGITYGVTLASTLEWGRWEHSKCHSHPLICFIML
jgi:hypothetical protein